METVVRFVTSVTPSYLWGGLLLASSIKQAYPSASLEVLPLGLSREELLLLEGVGNIILQENLPATPQNMCCQKATALLNAVGDVLVWCDADCLIRKTSLSDYIPEQGKIKIRFRDEEENMHVFTPYYQEEERTGIPQWVSDEWQTLQDSKENPRYTTQCVTNCFSLWSSERTILHRWKKQLEALFPAGISSVIERDAGAFFMTDESVFASLLIFWEGSPRYQELPVVTGEPHGVIHFGLHPKPWVCWQTNHLPFIPDVTHALSYLKRKQMHLPYVPFALRHAARISPVIWKILHRMYKVYRRGKRFYSSGYYC